MAGSSWKLREAARICVVLIVVGLGSLAYYFAFFSDENGKEQYIYWSGTITFVWQDASLAKRDYAIGRGRYEVRLLNGAHVEARTYLDEKFLRFDCVLVRQLAFTLSAAPTYEIVERTRECWQPA